VVEALEVNLLSSGAPVHGSYLHVMLAHSDVANDKQLATALRIAHGVINKLPHTCVQEDSR